MESKPNVLLIVFSISCCLVVFMSNEVSSLFSLQTYAKLELQGSSWPNWIYKSVDVTWDLECLNICKVENSSCSFVYFESSSGTCYLGLLGFWYASFPNLATGNALGLADFGKLQTALQTSFTKVTTTSTSLWQNYIYITNTFSPHGFWSCFSSCFNGEHTWCAYFVWVKGSCYIGNEFLGGGTQPALTVDAYVQTAGAISYFYPTTPMNGSFWSTKVYEVVANLTNNQCASYCFMPGNPRCRFYVYDSLNCYLCNLIISSSVIAARSDSQIGNVNGAGALFVQISVSDSAYSNWIFRNTSGSTIGDCLLACINSLDCHYTIFQSGVGCLIGNFFQTPIPVTYTIGSTAYVRRRLASYENDPSSKYFRSTLPVSNFASSITDFVNFIYDENLCSALCTLRLHDCNFFFVYFNGCYMGALGAVSGRYGIPGGGSVMIRRLYQSSSIFGTGTFNSSCPSGYNLISCGTAIYQTNKIENYRGWWISSNTTCTCYDSYGIYCAAWCTTLPLINITTPRFTSNGVVPVSCPAKSKNLGCSIRPNPLKPIFRVRYSIPSKDNSSCSCNDPYEVTCQASCATNVQNYEIVSDYGFDIFHVFCGHPDNFVLGCGFESDGPDAFATAFAETTTSCTCHSNTWYGGTCYAVCGQIIA